MQIHLHKQRETESNMKTSATSEESQAMNFQITVVIFSRQCHCPQLQKLPKSLQYLKDRSNRLLFLTLCGISTVTEA